MSRGLREVFKFNRQESDDLCGGYSGISHFGWWCLPWWEEASGWWARNPDDFWVSESVRVFMCFGLPFAALAMALEPSCLIDPHQGKTKGRALWCFSSKLRSQSEQCKRLICGAILSSQSYRTKQGMCFLNCTGPCNC